MRKVKGFRGVYNSMTGHPSCYFARVRRNDRWLFSRNFKTPEEAAKAFEEISQTWREQQSASQNERERHKLLGKNVSRRKLKL